MINQWIDVQALCSIMIVKTDTVAGFAGLPGHDKLCTRGKKKKHLI